MTDRSMATELRSSKKGEGVLENRPALLVFSVFDRLNSFFDGRSLSVLLARSRSFSILLGLVRARVLEREAPGGSSNRISPRKMTRHEPCASTRRSPPRSAPGPVRGARQASPEGDMWAVLRTPYQRREVRIRRVGGPGAARAISSASRAPKRVRLFSGDS